MRIFSIVALAGLLFGCGDGRAALSVDASSSDAAATTCDYHGTIHQVGDQWPADDGCNGCYCYAGANGNPPQWGCTLIGCPADAGAPDARPMTCDYNGQTYANGQMFPYTTAQDCTMCTCVAPGTAAPSVACDFVLCLPDAAPVDAN